MSCSSSCPRTLFKSLLDKIPMNEVKKSAELLPGGDLRSTRNAWVRAAWEHSGLKMVPREKQIRLAIGKLEKKRKICTPPEYGTLLSSFILDVFLFGMVALFRNMHLLSR